MKLLTRPAYSKLWVEKNLPLKSKLTWEEAPFVYDRLMSHLAISKELKPPAYLKLNQTSLHTKNGWFAPIKWVKTIPSHCRPLTFREFLELYQIPY